MKKTTGFALAALVSAVFATGAQAGGRDDGSYPPAPRHSPRGQPYLLLRGGVFEPNDSGRDDGLSSYDSGWSFGAAVGSRVAAAFAVEATAGVYDAENGHNEVQVVPLTVGARFIIPTPFIEPYLGAGLGLYLADLKEEAAPNPDDFSGIDDSSTTVGGYLSMGVDAWMSPNVALNFEGRYDFANASFESKHGKDFDVDVGGWTVNLGVRYEF